MFANFQSLQLTESCDKLFDQFSHIKYPTPFQWCVSSTASELNAFKQSVPCCREAQVLLPGQSFPHQTKEKDNLVRTNRCYFIYDHMRSNSSLNRSWCSQQDFSILTKLQRKSITDLICGQVLTKVINLYQQIVIRSLKISFAGSDLVLVDDSICLLSLWIYIL